MLTNELLFPLLTIIFIQHVRLIVGVTVFNTMISFLFFFFIFFLLILIINTSWKTKLFFLHFFFALLIIFFNVC